MALARILTHFPERAASLAKQLKQQGYRVDIARPDQTNLSPADLEIEFDVSERADVLEHAAGLGDEQQADVAVAPGVLQTEPEPVIAQAATPMAADQVSDREREFEAAFQPIHTEAAYELEPAARADLHEKEQPQVIDFPVIEQTPLHPSKLEPSLPATPEPLPPVQFLEEPPAINSATETPMIEAAKRADPVPYLAQLTPFGTPQAENAERFSNREPEQQVQPKVAASKPAGPSLGKRAADFMGRSLAAMKVGAAETAESFREHMQEYKKRAQVRAAERHAARVARMLDLEQRQAEAQERARELEVAREAAANRLAELLRERDPGLREEGFRQERLREEMLYEASKPAARPNSVARSNDVPKPRKAVEALRHASIAGLIKRTRRPMSPQLRAVLTGAAAVSVLFVIGIVLGVLQPRGPLASTASRPASTSSPSNGGVTVQAGGGGGVTVQTGTPATSSSGASTARAGAPAIPAKVQPAPASTAETPAKPSPRVTQTRRQLAEQSEQDIGDDVVVRHFNQPVPTQKPKQSGQSAGLKHFSDMEN
jgi:hypothetical protein